MFHAAKITLSIDFLPVTLINFATDRPEGLFIYRRRPLPRLKGASFHKASFRARQAWPSPAASHRSLDGFAYFLCVNRVQVGWSWYTRPRLNSRGALTSFVLFPLASRTPVHRPLVRRTHRTHARERGSERAERLMRASNSGRFDCCGERRINFHSRRRCTANCVHLRNRSSRFINKRYSWYLFRAGRDIG